MYRCFQSYTSHQAIVLVPVLGPDELCVTENIDTQLNVTSTRKLHIKIMLNVVPTNRNATLLRFLHHLQEHDHLMFKLWKVVLTEMVHCERI